MRSIYLIVAFVLFGSVAAFAQARPADDDTAAAPIVASAKAKYMGGMFGFDEKEEGTLKFDDENNRVVFFGKNNKEQFALPYDTLLYVSPHSQSVTSNTGNVVRSIPLPGSVFGGLIKEKHRYLIVEFNDPDVNVRGTVSFKVSSKALLDSVIHSLGTKAKMTKRGGAFYRPKPARTEI